MLATKNPSLAPLQAQNQGNDFLSQLGFADRAFDISRAQHLSGLATYVAGTLDIEGFFDALPKAELVRAARRDAKGWFREIPIQPEQARGLFDTGFTICATRINAENHENSATGLSRLVAAFAKDVQHPGEAGANVYLSPDGEGFDLHFDAHPVWVVQLIGQKKWRHGLTAVDSYPARGITFPPDRDVLQMPWGATYHRPAHDELIESHLKPGDVLYLPAGCWHEAQAQGISLAVSLSHSRSTGLDLIRKALTPLLMQEPALLQALPEAPGGHISQEYLQDIAHALHRLADQINADALHAAWSSQK